MNYDMNYISSIHVICKVPVHEKRWCHTYPKVVWMCAKLIKMSIWALITQNSHYFYVRVCWSVSANLEISPPPFVPLAQNSQHSRILPHPPHPPTHPPPLFISIWGWRKCEVSHLSNYFFVGSLCMSMYVSRYPPTLPPITPTPSLPISG